MKRALTILYIVVAVLILAVIYIYCRSLSFCDGDSAGTLVTTLGIMVTLLVGWQIYKSIEYDKLMCRLRDIDHIIEGYAEFAIGMTRLEKNPEDTLLHCVLGLEHLNNATHAKYRIIFDVLESISESPHSDFTKANKRRLLSALKKTHEPFAEELIDRFSAWPTKD